MLTFERQIGCPNQLRSAPGSDDVTLRHCCWQTVFCAASPQCTQVLKWHAADHFDCGGPGSTLAWASVSPIAYRRLHLAQLHGTLRHGFRRAAAWVSRRFNPTLHTILHTSDTYDTIDTCIYTYDMIIETYNLYIYNVKPLSYLGFKS